MNNIDIWQLIGYFSTILVFISFLMTSIVRLRLINLIGSGIFVIYALAIKSYPTALMNFGIVCIQIYYLLQLKKNGYIVTTLHQIETNSDFLKDFLNYYDADIHKYFPNFNSNNIESSTAWLTCYNMNPVGICIGEKTEGNTFDIFLDYTIPTYRDSSVGRFLYPKLLLKEGFSSLQFKSPSGAHAKYLESAGFIKEGEIFIK